MTKGVLEKDIQRSITEWLGWHKLFWWRNNSGAFVRDNHFYRFGDSGSPDLFVVKKGKIYGIEVKQLKGKQSPAQKEWQDGFEKQGGVYILARSIDDLKELEK